MLRRKALDCKELLLESKSLLRFHKAAEAAGYPVLLIISVVALATVVAPVALLGITESVWAFGLAIVSLLMALAVVAAAIHTAVSDGDDPATGRAGSGSAAGEHERAVPPHRRTARQAERRPA